MYKQIKVNDYANNKTSLRVSIFDDNNTILERYCLTIENTLPVYFSIKSIKDDKYKIIDIRNQISEYKKEDIIDNNITSILFSSFDISKQTLGLLWVQYFGIELNNIDIVFNYMHKYDQKYFSTLDVTKSKLTDFDEYVKKERERIAEILKKNDENYELLENDEKESFNMEPINISRYTIAMSLTIPLGYRLVDVFDDMNTTQQIPFLYFRHKQKNIQFFKLYEGGYYSSQWVHNFDTDKEYIGYNEVILLKILTSDKSVEMENNYSDVLLFLDSRSNILHISIIIPENSFINMDISKLVLDTFGDRLTYKINNEKKTDIYAKFNITSPAGLVINKAIFADFVTNVEPISYFFFFDERKKTSLSKKIMYCFFKPNYSQYQHLGNRPLLFVPIPSITDQKQPYLEVIIYRAIDMSQIVSLYALFEKVILFYLTNQSNIIDEYVSIIPSFKNYLSVEKKKTHKKTRIKKTGLRADVLKNIQPNLFGVKGYTEKCQKHAQPYHMTKQEYEEKKDTFDNPDKVIEYPIDSGNYYACEPRVPSDGPKAKGYIWPSLQKNKLANNDIYGYIPCCAKQNQMDKKSGLRDYLASVGKVEKKNTKQQKPDTDYILGSNKILDEGRMGNLPFFLYELAKYVGYKYVTKEKKDVLTLVRMGIKNSPDSILWCLETALNKSFSKKDNAEKEKIISKLKDNLTDENFLIAKGETVGYTRKELKNMIYNGYIDPDIFIRILEKYYSSVYGNVTILVFKIDKITPQGDLSVPSYKLFPIQRPVKKSNKFVLITKFETESSLGILKTYPYNCELIKDFSLGTTIFSEESAHKQERKLISYVYKFFQHQINIQCVNEDYVMRKIGGFL